MKPRWDGPRFIIQTGARPLFRPDHSAAGGHDIQELWRWWCAACSTRDSFIGDNGEDLDEALEWIAQHVATTHEEDR